MVTDNIASINASDLKNAPQYTILITEDNTDLEISADYSLTLYAPNILLVKSDAKVNRVEDVYKDYFLSVSNIVS